MRPRLNSTDKAILALAIPALGSLAIDPLLGIADTAFVARLGSTELAALGVATTILTAAFFLFNFLASVLTPLVARALGARDEIQARVWVGDALLLALVLGVVSTVVLLVAAPALVGLMGAGETVADPAVVYLRIRASSTTAVLVVAIGNGAFRGHKDTVTPLKVVAVINGVNLVLDPLMIFTLGWGLAGAAVATVIAQGLGALWFIRLMVVRAMVARPRNLAESLPSLFAIGRNGVLLTLRTGFLLGTFTVAAATATRIGPEEIAAHQVVAQIFILSALLADSFAVAAQPMVAEAAAGGDVGLVNGLVRRLAGWGGLAGVVLLVLVAGSRPLLPLIASDSVVSDQAVEAALVVALQEPVTAVLFVADGIFLGLLALGTMVVSTGLGAVGAVGLMMFTPLGDSLTGIWIAIAVLMALRGVVLVAGYRRSVGIALRS